jgi:hypothetical protein
MCNRKIVYALKKDAKEFWCSEVRKLRARPGISGESGNSGKKSKLSGPADHQ